MNLHRLIKTDSFFKYLHLFLVGLKGLIPRKKKKNDQYVVMKFFGLGSITRIVYVIDQLDIPKSQITFITFEQNKAILDLLNVRGIYIKNHNFLTLTGNSFSAIFSVWNMRKTTVLDMERSSHLAGIFRVLISCRKPCFSFDFSEKNWVKGNQTFIDLMNKSALTATAEMFGRQLKLNPPTLQQTGVKTNEILININAGDYLPERMFPQENFIPLIKQVHQLFPEVKLVFTGAAKEFERVTQFVKALTKVDIPKDNIINLSGKLTLDDLKKRLESSFFFITNDSGPLHLAQYFGVKTVCIWGPTSAQFVGYPSSDIMLNLVPDESCHPCFIHPKSEVAQACDGKLTCFQSMEIQKMRDQIMTFTSKN